MIYFHYLNCNNRDRHSIYLLSLFIKLHDICSTLGLDLKSPTNLFGAIGRPIKDTGEVYLSVCVCLSICLCVCLYICLSVSVYLSIYISQSVYLSRFSNILSTILLVYNSKCLWFQNVYDSFGLQCWKMLEYHYVRLG